MSTGGSSGDGTFTDDDRIDEGEGGGYVLPDWVSDLRPLAYVAGTLAVFGQAFSEESIEILTDFVDDPAGFILNELQVILVGWVLSAWAYALGWGLRVWDILIGTLEAAIIIPIRDSFVPIGAAFLGALGTIQSSTTANLADAGIAAPFALAGGWVAATLFVVIVFQVAWGIVQTYLPVESVTDVLDVLRSLVERDSNGGREDD